MDSVDSSCLQTLGGVTTVLFSGYFLLLLTWPLWLVLEKITPARAGVPQHQDKNFSIWLPMFDIAFGSYYRPEVDEYPATGLSSGEKIDTLWQAQAGPLIVWWRSLRKLCQHGATEPVKDAS